MSAATPDRQRAALQWLATYWWVVFSFLGGLFTWLSFYIAGMRLHRRELIMTGTAYSAFSALTWFAFTSHEIEYSDTASTLAAIGLVIGWFGGAAHAWSVAVAYSKELEGGGRSRRGRRRRGEVPGRTSADGFGLASPAGDYLATSAPPDAGAVIEANTASAGALRRLPNMTDELVERWIAERDRRGGFRDLAELTRALDLAPHQVVRLRPRISFEDPGPYKARRSGRGRVLDV